MGTVAPCRPFQKGGSGPGPKVPADAHDITLGQYMPGNTRYTWTPAKIILTALYIARYCESP